MSPMPHLFGNPPDSANPGGNPTPGRVLVSDLLTMEDYRKLRYGATKRSVMGGLLGGLGGAFAVRHFWPKRPSPNALVLIGLGESQVDTSPSVRADSRGRLRFRRLRIGVIPSQRDLGMERQGRRNVDADSRGWLALVVRQGVLGGPRPGLWRDGLSALPSRRQLAALHGREGQMEYPRRWAARPAPRSLFPTRRTQKGSLDTLCVVLFRL